MNDVDIKNSDISLGKNKRPIIEFTDNMVKLQKKKDSNVSEISGKIFSYCGKEIDIIYKSKDDPWLKGSDMGRFLFKYKDTNFAVRKYVSSQNKMILKDLVEFNPEKFSSLKKNDGASLYVNISGVTQLLDKTKKKIGETFREWLHSEVMPEIQKTGNYIGKNNNFDTIVDPSLYQYEEYTKKNIAYDIKDTNVIYLGSVGIVKQVGTYQGTNVSTGEELFKYGITERGVIREDEHKAKIDGYVMFYVQKCMWSKKVENDLKEEFEVKGLLRKCRINGKVQTELFITTDTFTLNDVQLFIENWIKNYKDKEKSENLLLSEELTKQKQLDLEILKIQVEKIKMEFELLNLKK